MKEFLVEHFLKIQIAVCVVFLLLWTRRSVNDRLSSNFKLREADRGLKFKRETEGQKSGDAKLKATPFQLTGIRIDGAAHEILGISAVATEAEIQKSYRELMKRYHPDLIGRPGSREWEDAQKIAEAINRARTEMLERLKNRR